MKIVTKVLKVVLILALIGVMAYMVAAGLPEIAQVAA